VVTFATMNWKSAPITHRQSAGKVNAQYESPFRCTAANTNEMRYAKAPIAMSNLFDTLCCISAATRLARRPKTTIGSMCTPVMSEE